MKRQRLLLALCAFSIALTLGLYVLVALLLLSGPAR